MSSLRVHLRKLGSANRSVCRHTSRPSRKLLLSEWEQFTHWPSCGRPRCVECVAYVAKVRAKADADAAEDNAYWERIRQSGFTTAKNANG